MANRRMEERTVVDENGEEWYVKPSGKRQRLSTAKAYEEANRKRLNSASNAKAMYVNGKYVPLSHPLHKPGRYSTFEDAAFSSLKNYEARKEGQVYIITNPAFNGWVKVGMAVDASDRLRSYQTSSPFRDYELYKAWDTEDRKASESLAHSMLLEKFDRKNEWFNCSAREAREVLEEMFE